jgi:hypothetical protein
LGVRVPPSAQKQSGSKVGVSGKAVVSGAITVFIGSEEWNFYGVPMLSHLKEFLVKIPLIYALVDARKSSNPSRTRQWVLKELLRRAISRNQPRIATMFLSYPRSGNHLVRFVVESCSGRPTLGFRDHENFFVPKCLHDNPIFLRDPNVHIKDPRPILVKRHTPDFQPERLLFLVRNPVTAILSHLGRDLKEIPEDELSREADLFMENCYFYRDFSSDNKMLLFLEDILEAPVPRLSILLEFLGIESFREKLSALASNLDIAERILQRPADPNVSGKFKESMPKSYEYLKQYFDARSQDLNAIGIYYDY